MKQIPTLVILAVALVTTSASAADGPCLTRLSGELGSIGWAVARQMPSEIELEQDVGRYFKALETGLSRLTRVELVGCPSDIKTAFLDYKAAYSRMVSIKRSNRTRFDTGLMWAVGVGIAGKSVLAGMLQLEKGLRRRAQDNRSSDQAVDRTWSALERALVMRDARLGPPNTPPA